MDVNRLKGWLVVAVVVGPLLALFLPHDVRLYVIDAYIAGPLLLAVAGSPVKEYQYG